MKTVTVTDSSNGIKHTLNVDDILRIDLGGEICGTVFFKKKCQKEYICVQENRDTIQDHLDRIGVTYKVIINKYGGYKLIALK